MPLAYEPQRTTMKLPNATAPTPDSANRPQEEGYRRRGGGVPASGRIFAGAAKRRMRIRTDVHQPSGARDTEPHRDPDLGYCGCAEGAVPGDGPWNGEMGYGAAEGIDHSFIGRFQGLGRQE